MSTFGWGLTEDGHRIGFCTFAHVRDEQDTGDAEYWRSVGFHRMAESSERRRDQRRRLMGWPPFPAEIKR